VLPADGIHIEYVAPASCPSESAFGWQVRARVHQVIAPARKYAVTLSVEGAHARGTLRVEEESRTSVRDISGTSCDEIAEGLALILALVIDPGARTERARDLPPPPTERAPEPKTVISLPPPLPNAGAEATSPARVEATSWRPSLELAAGAVARGAIAPGTATSGRFYAEGGLDRPGAASPHLRLSFEYAQSSTAVESAGTARFTWIAGTLQACHAAQVLERTLSVPICVGFELGRLEASGSNAPNAQTQRQAWIALDAELGLRWFPWSAPIFVDFEGGLQLPLERARFFFVPNTTVYTTPRVAQFVGAGAGVRLF
jgi:hypothetical protein